MDISETDKLIDTGHWSYKLSQLSYKLSQLSYRTLVTPHLCVGVAVAPHAAALVHDPVDHDAHPLLPVHGAAEHLPRLAPDLLLPPDALHHLLAHQLQQVRRALHLPPAQA